MWVLIVLVAVAHGAMMGCTNATVDLPACAFFLFDANHDGQITVAEIDTRLQTTPIAGVNGEMLNVTRFMNICDTNNDTVFTQADWDYSPCITSFTTTKVICALCYRNGYIS